MPGKNTIKKYVENGYYHLYNRGVEKRSIFQDEQDYGVFLSYIKEYLLPKDVEGLFESLANPQTQSEDKNRIRKSLALNNFNQHVTLLAYCLMPNHYHLLVRQRNPGTIDRFINSLGTRYTMYFNRKYARVGALYQGVYRAVMVQDDSQLLCLSRYIHKQAGESNQPSSYPEYLGARKSQWLSPDEILGYFNNNYPSLSYEGFMEEWEDPTPIDHLTLDEV